MRRLERIAKRLEESVAIERARKLSEEEGIWFRVTLTNAEVSDAVRKVADAEREHGRDSEEFLAAVREADPILEQGVERYKQEQAEKEGRQ